MSVIKKFRIIKFKQKKPLLKLENINIAFANRPILQNINLEINHGEILGMLGPNGVGKSTIFNLITGLIKPDKGKIIIKDENVNEYPIFVRTSRFKLNICPQIGGYFFDLTLQENLKAVAEIQIKEARTREEKINYLISKFDLENIRDIKARFLSGGQKTFNSSNGFVRRSRIVLLDEPFSALDIKSIKTLQDIIINLQSERKISICITDHQAADLLRVCDSAIVLADGKVVAKGTPSELVKNENAINAYFGDSLNLINLMVKIVIQKKIKDFNKIINVDGDKSLSIRSLLIGSQSYGICKIKNLPKAEDVLSTIKGLRRLGVKIIFKNRNCYLYGNGLNGFSYKKY